MTATACSSHLRTVVTIALLALGCDDDTLNVRIVELETDSTAYLNRRVRVEGRVTGATTLAEDVRAGTYTLRDASEREIDVRTDEVPAPGELLTVTAVLVEKREGNRSRYLREEARSSGTSSSTGGTVDVSLIASLTVFALTLGLFIGVLLRRRRSTGATQRIDAPVRVSPIESSERGARPPSDEQEEPFDESGTTKIVVGRLQLGNGDERVLFHEDTLGSWDKKTLVLWPRRGNKRSFAPASNVASVSKGACRFEGELGGVDVVVAGKNPIELHRGGGRRVLKHGDRERLQHDDELELAPGVCLRFRG